MTTPDLPARVEEALADVEFYGLASASFTQWTRLVESSRAMLADWKRLRERERVLTEALRDASHALDAVQGMAPDIIKPAAQRARAALTPETK